jgi:hypothetical protein
LNTRTPTLGRRISAIGALLVALLAGCGSVEVDIAAELAEGLCGARTADALRTIPRDVEEHLAELAGEPKPRGNALLGVLWQKHTLQVGWDTFEPEYAEERGWVRDAVTSTWQEHSGLRFEGWGKANAQTDIRIRVAEERPMCRPMGKNLKGKAGGLTLNFAFETWPPPSNKRHSGRRGVSWREYAIRGIAVHEFGHVIGLCHEQNRKDKAPYLKHHPRSACSDDVLTQQGTPGDFYIGRWDLESCMNYGNPRWNNDGRLSSGDRETVAMLYPKEGRATSLGGTWEGRSNDKLDDERSLNLGATLTLRELNAERIDGHLELDVKCAELSWSLSASVTGTRTGGAFLLLPFVQEVNAVTSHKGRLEVHWSREGVLTVDDEKQSRQGWEKARDLFNKWLGRMVGLRGPKTLDFQATIQGKHVRLKLKPTDK